MILTPAQMAEGVLKILENSVKNYPENEREEMKIIILNGFSKFMFKGPTEPKENI